MKHFNCSIADLCLPDYWGGHHLPHICVPVYKDITFVELKNALHSEVTMGAIAGSFDYNLLDNDLFYVRLHAAIDRSVKPRVKYARVAFPDVEEQDEDADSCYAYFVFEEK